MMRQVNYSPKIEHMKQQEYHEGEGFRGLRAYYEGALPGKERPRCFQGNREVCGQPTLNVLCTPLTKLAAADTRLIPSFAFFI